MMKQNPSYEDLKQKVTDLEGRLREYENRGAEQHIQEVTKRLEKIAEMGDDGIIVFDEDYQIEFANAVASEITGYAKERLTGMDFRRILSERDIGYLDQMHSKVGIDESKRVCTEMEVMTEKNVQSAIPLITAVCAIMRVTSPRGPVVRPSSNASNKGVLIRVRSSDTGTALEKIASIERNIANGKTFRTSHGLRRRPMLMKKTTANRFRTGIIALRTFLCTMVEVSIVPARKAPIMGDRLKYTTK